MTDNVCYACEGIDLKIYPNDVYLEKKIGHVLGCKGEKP